MEISCRRIRKGFPSEARVVARILPQFLDDFFPLQDVMNKVIGEFLSNQQPYPQFMATVVYKASATFWAQTFFYILNSLGTVILNVLVRSHLRNFTGKIGQLSVVNNIAIYEAQLTQK